MKSITMSLKTKFKLVVLTSNAGTGTNLQAIIDGIESGKINAEISAVISDTEDAFGLVRAKKHNINTLISKNKDELLAILQNLNPDYICLAGWKQIVKDEVIDTYPDKILNLHPGLVPDTLDGKIANPDGTFGLWNKGIFDTKAIKNLLDTKVTFAGASIHFLTKEFDFGPVLGRTFEKIEPGDTIASLYDRLKQKQGNLFVEVLAKLCNLKN